MQVKRLFNEQWVAGTSANVLFAGAENYLASRRQVMCGLFARDDESSVWFADFSVSRSRLA